MDDDVVRIVISTDNHLGFQDKSPVRYADSFAAFEEVLHSGKKALKEEFSCLVCQHG
jgi:hypothetical protein